MRDTDTETDIATTQDTRQNLSPIKEKINVEATKCERDSETVSKSEWERERENGTQVKSTANKTAAKLNTSCGIR